MEYKSEERQNLLSRLLDAVKQCQIRFGGKRELATDTDPRVSCLCQQLEAVLQHGLRQPETISTPFRQVREVIAQNLNISLNGPPSEPSVMWHYVRQHLTRHEYERYLLLVNISTDSGRGRAWLRSALNEHSLERYLHALIGDCEGMARFYEPWAVLADPERNAMLPNIAAGLSSVLFAISIDREELNGGRSRSRPRPVEISAGPARPDPEAVVNTHSVEVRSSRAGGRRRRRRVQAHVVSLDGDDTSGAAASPTWRSAPATCVSSPAPEPAGAAAAFSFDGGGGEQDGSSRSEVSLPATSSAEDLSRLEEAGIEAASQQLRPCAADVSSLMLQVDTSNLSVSSAEPADSPAAQQEVYNGLSNWVGSADDAVPAKIDTSPDQSAGPMDLEAISPAERALAAASLSEGELREALVSVGAQRTTLSDLVSQLRADLAAVREERDRLREEAETSSAAWRERLAVVESRRLTSERENGILKHQLKNYVSAVQQLRHGSPHEVLQQLQREQREQRSQHDDYHAEAQAYQHKLIQVAEMHGELMEFNERLQARLGRRERQLAGLRAELAECGLGRPASDLSDTEEPPCRADTAPATRPRVHCWIPATFLSGSGSSAHHVYQVYVRIRDEEWNVYHRYSTFYLLYKKMKKEFSEIRRFDFPPKKTLNKKDGRLVEQRRRRLQEFLRCVTRVLLEARPELARAPCRAALLAEEPFFGQSGAAGGQASGAGMLARSAVAAPARYTGL